MIVTYNKGQVTLDLTAQEETTLLWVEANNPGKFRNMIMKFINERTVNRERADMLAMAEKIHKLPQAERDEIMSKLV